VYLPAGSTWTDAWTGVVFEGGRRVKVKAPLAVIPVFMRGDAVLPMDPKEFSNLIK
jgi:alpha-D-xyloside xylohydrolase